MTANRRRTLVPAVECRPSIPGESLRSTDVQGVPFLDASWRVSLLALNAREIGNAADRLSSFSVCPAGKHAEWLS